MDKEHISLLAIVANVVLAIAKIGIGLMSKSSAVFAEGLHSAMDIVSSFLSFIGIRLSRRPADKKHPYGHHKFEVLSGLVITVILAVTGLWILYEAYKGFIDPQVRTISYLALGVMAFSAVINEIMARLKLHFGRKEHSIALISDGIHSRLDVISSVAVFVGLFLTPFFRYIDPLLTVLIGLYILKESFGLGKEAIDSLLDVSAGDEIEGEIRKVIKGQDIELSDLKTQKKGSVITANVVIRLPKRLSVEEADKICNDLQVKLIESVSNLQYVAIQISSHDVEYDYFQPTEVVSGVRMGKAVGWRKGKFVESVPDAEGKGPGGRCVCPKCGFESTHKRSVPCSKLRCDKCNSHMTRA